MSFEVNRRKAILFIVQLTPNDWGSEVLPPGVGNSEHDFMITNSMITDFMITEILINAIHWRIGSQFKWIGTGIDCATEFRKDESSND